MILRKAKKYRLSLHEFYSIKNKLLESGMSKLFEKRRINSLYYDTDLLDMYFHSEEGVLPRKKIRLRWYQSSKNAHLETKISSIEGRSKTVNSSGQLVANNFPNEITDQVYGVIKPSLLVTYIREYYTFNNMRITFDASISYQNKRILSLVNFLDSERVMEIKIGNDISDDYVETFIPYSTTRFSKYTRGLSASLGVL